MSNTGLTPETASNKKLKLPEVKTLLTFVLITTLVTLGYSIYSHNVMRSKFREVYRLILQNPAASTAQIKAPLSIDTKDLPLLGSPDAPLELVLISDFECPFCEALGGKILQSLRTNLVDRGLLRIYYLSRPLASHKNGQVAARVAMAAHSQGKFWAMYDELFSGQPLGQALYESAARKIGLDMSQYEKDLKSREITAELQRHQSLGNTLNPPGVPAILYSGRLLVGDAAWSSLESELNSSLTSSSSQTGIDIFETLIKLPGTSVVDVRTAEEFATSALQGAIQIDYYATDFLDQVKAKVPEDSKILLYCKSGFRSALAWHVLAQAGYSGHLTMESGISAWTAAGKPVQIPASK